MHIDQAAHARHGSVTHALVLQAPLVISPLCCRMRRLGLTVKPMYVRPLARPFAVSACEASR